MYIKLGTIQAVRKYDDPNDFMILSEVPSSSMSFESPTKVRTLDELNIWFGKTYPEYSYLRELIESRVTLYLYKPVSPENNPIESWTDLYYDGEIEFPELPETGEEGYKYHSSDGTYVWYLDENNIGGWISASDYPDKTIESLDNRDTLVISGEYSCNPKYLGPGKFKSSDNIEIDLSSEGIYTEIMTLSGDLGDGYLGFRDSQGSWVLVWSGALPKDLKEHQEITYYEISGLSELLEVLGRYFDISEYLENSWHIRSTYGREPITMCSFDGLTFSEDFEENESLIFRKLEDIGYIGFWGKTIGRDRNSYDIDESRIKIELENLGQDGWKLEVSRYGYIEYWIGSLEGSVGQEGIFDKANRESKLIQCEIVGRDITKIISEGAWYLDGAKVEVPSASWYRKSMDLLLGTLDDSVCPDFFMIPRISFYGERHDEQLFLPYAQAGNFQFLIGLKDTEYLENCLDDKENRLLYFYGNIITEQRELRPGWYLYLRGLLRNSSIYQDRDILYTTKVNQKIDIHDLSWEVHNPYITLDEVLDHYKCNYLVWNNQYYYYNKYQNGSDYETSGTLRFIMGKVYRELQKHRWKIIGQRYSTVIKNTIEEILESIRGFESVDRIYITKFYPLLEISTIDLEVEIYTKELLKNNVTLDITINYKKQ